MKIHDDLWQHLRVKHARMFPPVTKPCRHPNMHQSWFPHVFHMPWRSPGTSGIPTASNWPTLAAMELICVCRFCCLFLLLHLGTMAGIFWAKMRNLNDNPSILGCQNFKHRQRSRTFKLLHRVEKQTSSWNLVCIPETQPNSCTNVIISEQNT